MTRIFLFVLLVVSLASAPGPAFAGAAADCPMAMASGMVGDGMAAHKDMGCCAPACAPDCALACPGAVVPLVGAEVGQVRADGLLSATWPPCALPSIDPGTVDPPPRTTTS
ncbi:MAG TPA: hypothetical protein VEW04_10825 [Allosphingosinicella sp.]|nr:hypothetical protein [Allosphingosinicella sp.]